MAANLKGGFPNLMATPQLWTGNVERKIATLLSAGWKLPEPSSDLVPDNLRVAMFRPHRELRAQREGMVHD